MSILQALSTISFFVNINQGIDRTLALLEVKEKNATLKGQPVLIDCINLMLCSLTVLENELTAIAAATDTAIATVTDTAIATVTDTAIATATDTTTVTVTDTVIAAATDTAIVTESTTVIDDDFQLVTFEEMTDYLFFQQSWKMIKDPSLAMKGQGYLSDRIDSSVWSFNKVLPVYYDKENKMIIVKSGLSFYGCIAGYLSIDELKWQFAHNLLHDLKHCNATESTDTAIATESTTAIATESTTAIATESITAIATESTTAIATESTTAIATATDTVTATVKTETEANRALSKYQKLWYLQQIDYPEIEELKGIASINAAIVSVSSFMAAYKAVKKHGIPEKDPNKKSAKSDKQTVDASLPVATANISDIDFNGCNIINSPQLQTEKAEILSVNGIKVGGTIEIKKP